jgi:hypothetical protein
VREDKNENESDFFGGAWSSLQSGWGYVSAGASNLATQTGQGLSKFGTKVQENVLKPTATQANKFGNYVNDSVIQPTKQKAQEGQLWNDISTSATQFVSKVKTSGEKGWTDLKTWVQKGNENNENDHLGTTDHHAESNQYDNYREKKESSEEEEESEEETDTDDNEDSRQPKPNPVKSQELLIDFSDDGPSMAADTTIPIIPSSSTAANNPPGKKKTKASSGGYGSLSGGGQSAATANQGGWDNWGDGWDWTTSSNSKKD